MKTLKGEGFIVTPTDTIPADLEEHADLDAAQDRATQLLDKHGAVIIWAPVCVVRPKKDIVAKFTKFGGTFQKQLPSGEEHDLGSAL